MRRRCAASGCAGGMEGESVMATRAIESMGAPRSIDLPQPTPHIAKRCNTRRGDLSGVRMDAPMRVPFATPFLAGEPRATSLLSDRFRDARAWREEAEARRDRRVAPELVSALAAQLDRLPASDARRERLDALSRPGTV